MVTPRLISGASPAVLHRALDTAGGAMTTYFLLGPKPAAR